MANFRPVSNLTFFSKVVERVVTRQLNDYLAAANLLPLCQSAYRRHHSTETAMVRVLSDVLTAADTRQVTLLGLFDMSAALDCVDHSTIATTREELRSIGSCPAVADVISHQSDAASNIQWDAIQAAAIVVRCTARLGARRVTIQSPTCKVLINAQPSCFRNLISLQPPRNTRS